MLGAKFRVVAAVWKMLCLSIAVAASPASATPGGPAVQTHEYKYLDLAPDGSRVASVEFVSAATNCDEPRGPVVVRRSDDGTVIERLDPCHRCRYSGLAWSPDGARLAFHATDEGAGTALVADHDILVRFDEQLRTPETLWSLPALVWTADDNGDVDAEIASIIRRRSDDIDAFWAAVYPSMEPAGVLSWFARPGACRFGTLLLWGFGRIWRSDYAARL